MTKLQEIQKILMAATLTLLNEGKSLAKLLMGKISKAAKASIEAHLEKKATRKPALKTRAVRKKPVAAARKPRKKARASV